MAKKKPLYLSTEEDLRNMTLAEREERIRTLEVERLAVVRQIEEKMSAAANVRADSALSRRSARVGRASNDYRPIK